MIFRSLKKEILVFALGLTITTIVATTVIGILSTKNAGDSAAKSTSEVLRGQAEEFLVQLTGGAAAQQDLFFEQMRNETENLAVYVSNVYKNPSIFDTGYWKFDERVFRNGDQYLNSKSDVSTIHIPSFVALTQTEKKNIELTASLDFIVPSKLQSNPDIAAVYTIDSMGVSRYFPNIVLGSIAPTDYDPREDVYYKPATPKNNPEKKTIWSPLYDDAAGRGLMITATTPVYVQKSFAGIVGVDVLLGHIIESINAYSPIENSYAILVDNQGSTVAFPDQAYKDLLGRPKKEGEGRINLVSGATTSPQFALALEKMVSGSTGFQALDGERDRLFIAYAPLKQTGFSMAIIAQEATVLKAVGALRSEISDSIGSTIAFRILPASLFIILFASLVGFLLVSRIVKPIRQLTEGAREIGGGNLDYHLNIESKNEIGELASSFNHMSRNLKASREKLSEYSKGLEVLVEKRTHELKEANDELRTLDQAKSEFISIASHQLRAPLTAIKGYASMVLEGSFGSVTKKVKTAIDRVFISSNQLVVLVNDLLDLSRIEAGKMQYTFAPVVFSDTITKVIAEFEENARKKNIALVFKNDVPAGVSVRGDAEKLYEVAVNLIDNAIKYSPEGSVDIKLVSTEKGGAKSLLFSVADKGIGIGKEDISKLFIKFARSEEARKIRPDGMGIGLYFVKKIVEDHKGKVWVESAGVGYGSTFFVELPLS